MKKSSNVDLMKSNKIIEYIKNCSEKSSDISYRKVKFNDEYIYIVYADSMSSTDLISNFIIKSIVDYTALNAICQQFINIIAQPNLKQFFPARKVSNHTKCGHCFLPPQTRGWLD